MNTLPTSAWSLTTVTVPNKNGLLRSPEWVGGKSAAPHRQLGPSSKNDAYMANGMQGGNG